MILFALLSLLQIAAMLYVGIATVRINRMQTLSKNFEWVAQNKPFLEKNHYPVLWPLIACAVAMGGIIIAGLFKESSDLLLWGKYTGILSAVGIISILYFIIEKRLFAKIPLRKERSASLVKRTVGYYVHPTFVTISKGAALLVIAAAVMVFLLQGISPTTFLIDLTNALFTYSLLFGSIFWALKEKIPHENDISMVTTVNVGENYRKFSLNLLTAATVALSLLFLIQLALQWHGYDLSQRPVEGPLSFLYGKNSEQFHPVFTLQQWDMIFSGLSIPLFLFIARCKPFRDILAIKIKPTI
jgi:hypothetical protein